VYLVRNWSGQEYFRIVRPGVLQELVIGTG